MAKILGLIASSHPKGMTFQMVNAVLQGAAKAGAEVELVSLAKHRVVPCRDCNNSDKCTYEKKCSFADPGLEYICEKMLHCHAFVMGTPVYWKDTSAMAGALFPKLYRLFGAHKTFNGIPALGIAVAGNTGNGFISGVKPLYHLFQVLYMRALPPFPVTRFTWKAAMTEAEKQGAALAELAKERVPFEGLPDQYLWYDSLPYINMTRIQEMRLLASLAVAALPEEDLCGVARDFADAERLSAEGSPLEAVRLFNSVFWKALDAYNKRLGAPDVECPSLVLKTVQG